MDQITPKPVKQFKVIGTRPLRPDGVEKVTGKKGDPMELDMSAAKRKVKKK